MRLVLLTALGVGLATVFGAMLGFIFKRISHKFNDIILGFAAGVMLSASIIGLVLPSLNSNGKFSAVITVVGIFCGAAALNIIDKIVPHIHGFVDGNNADSARLDKIMLFVLAIAIHNFPEGLAAGVSFGSENISDALAVSFGIALQNIPEGMIIIAPMLMAGISKKKTFLIASLTGFIEVVGTLLGFFAVNISGYILPFALSFAGGTMLYVISDEMIPETHSHGNERSATYALLLGFCIMLLLDYYI